MAEYFAVSDRQIERVGIAHLCVWLLGVAAIFFAEGRAARRLREREREIGARAGLEQELAHARRLEGLGRLAGGVAHDLNNLLSPILGNAVLALERAPEPELRRDLEDIREAAQRARLLTQQLLAFGRKQVLSLEPLDPSEAVDGIVSMVRRLVGDGVEVRAELERSLPAIRADRGQLGAALLNLAANARDAMPGGGVLRIATAPAELDGAGAARHGVAPGRYVAITVSDTGHGMDDATRARLFEPFFTTKTSGNGLGLASAHGTVRQLGGTIEVDSTPGAGATFRVLLPVADEAAVVTPKPVLEAAVPRGTETVLVAEDEVAVRRYASAVLSGLGYRVLAVASGDEALAAERNHEGEIHALVSDLRMPGMGGPELREHLARRRPGIATVYITGYAGDTLGPEHVPPEGTVVVHKPFTPADLGAAVRGVLDARPPQPPSAASRSCADSHSA
jgi:signal transduction histidine kinase/CheY-like chemotaxis protein